VKYGARHLKRAIERSLVQPLSNLIATSQVRMGDLVLVDFDGDNKRITFHKEAEGMPPHAMAQLAGTPIPMLMGQSARPAEADTPRVAGARITRRT
ncbi:MAG: ATP-dependent Clp protease ATP-binding subunit, partial [Bryobacteraceae bacterium]